MLPLVLSLCIYCITFCSKLVRSQQAQCDGREGRRESSYGKRRKRRQTRNEADAKTDDNDVDFNLKEMFRVYENREEILGESLLSLA